MRKTRRTVIEHLEQYKGLRDDDRSLVALIWRDELMEGKGKTKAEATGLVLQLLEYNLTSAETITRARRKAQQDIPYLRGEQWEKRHKLQIPVQQSLDYNV